VDACLGHTNGARSARRGLRTRQAEDLAKSRGHADGSPRTGVIKGIINHRLANQTLVPALKIVLRD
jgi:hypothetical protein